MIKVYKASVHTAVVMFQINLIQTTHSLRLAWQLPYLANQIYVSDQIAKIQTNMFLLKNKWGERVLWQNESIGKRISSIYKWCC